MKTDSNLPTSKHPIGYWIKSADQALDRIGDATHKASGYSRRRWQVLSMIVQTEPVSISALVGQLTPMLDGEAVRAEVLFLEESDIVQSHDGMLRTTVLGQETHRNLAANQAEMRERAMHGIVEADYAATIRCLSRIVENLSKD